MTTYELTNMLKFLEMEEEFLNKVVKHMEQEHIRLQIEQLALKAAHRREKMKVENLSQKQSNSVSEACHKIAELDTLNSSPSQLQKKNKIDKAQNSKDAFNSAQSYPVSVQQPQIKSEFSNITDDRYLEPLCLKRNGYDDSELVEFD